MNAFGDWFLHTGLVVLGILVGAFALTKVVGFLARRQLRRVRNLPADPTVHANVVGALVADVHDLGHMNQPFAPGWVMTVEPAIYIPEEDLAVRLENDVLITANGPVDLMADIPIEAEEIEELMK
jgi:Xaa-Pro aminopeptidase